jgi:glycosyltransferase involved in cell wall biosynthesis
VSATTQKSSHPKIGIVVPGRFIPPTDGGQRVCYDLCIALAKITKVLCFSAHAKQSLHGLELLPLFSTSRLHYFNINLALKLARQLKSHNLKFCIVNQPYFVFFAFLACKLARCQLITYAHNLEFKRSDGLMRRLKPIVFILEFIAFHLSQRVFFISHSELVEARQRFRLAEDRCIWIPHIAHRPDRTSITKATKPGPFTVIFFGNFDYPPNSQGLTDLLQHIVPTLVRTLTFPCRLVVFGKAVPEFLQNQRVVGNLSIKVLGFLSNPANEIERADVMLNPISEGAGVQTKIIEALSLGTTVISAKSGARGIDPRIAQGKLLLVEDSDWEGFANVICEIQKNGNSAMDTPNSFYREYSEESLFKRVIPILQSHVNPASRSSDISIDK